MSASATLFPIFVNLHGRRAVVVGAGAIATPKIAALLRAGAVVQVVAISADAQVRDWARNRALAWHSRRFERADVRGAAVVFAATGVREIDREVFDVCREMRVLCNAVDDPEHCDFYSPAIVRRGDLQIAISTNGQSPALAQQIREELEQQFGPEWEERVRALGQTRREILAMIPAGPERTALLHRRARQAMASNTVPDVTKGEFGAHQSPRPVPAAETGDAARAGVLGRLARAFSDWLNADEDKVALI